MQRSESLRQSIAWAASRPLEDTMMDQATKTRVEEIGATNAAEAACVLLLDSTDESIKLKMLTLTLSHLLPKVVEHISRDLDLAEIPTSEILAHLGSIEGELLDTEDGSE